MGKQKKGTSPILWAVAGLGVGLAAGLLLTPEKGEEMRKKIKAKALNKLDSALESIELSLEKAYVEALKSESEEAGKEKKDNTNPKS